MGLPFLLLFWLVFGGLLSLVPGAFLGAVVKSLTLGAEETRTRAIWAARLFPFLCLTWAITIIVPFGIINETVFQRDPGFADYARTPLPNGYSLSMPDNRGNLSNPKTLPPGVFYPQDDNVADVTQLQLSGPYILGEAVGNPEGSFFLLDARTGKRQFFSSMDTIYRTAAPLGITPRFEPVATVFSRYRVTWFDRLEAYLLLGGPLIGFALLCLLVWRVRRGRVAAEANLAMIPPAA
jgi:hypothetical protein